MSIYHWWNENVWIRWSFTMSIKLMKIDKTHDSMKLHQWNMKYINMANTNMIFIIFMMSDENESLRWKNKKLMKIQLCEIIILMNQLKYKIKIMREMIWKFISDMKIHHYDENLSQPWYFITMTKFHHNAENSSLWQKFITMMKVPHND